jgi:hypothetical protein
MSNAACIVLIVLASTCWVGAAPGPEPDKSKEVEQPWWATVRGGVYGFQYMYGSGDCGWLWPADENKHGIGLGLKEGWLAGVGGGRWFYRWLGVEATLSRFDVELGGDDLFEETGEGVPVKIGTCTVDTIQLTVLFGGDSSPRNRLSGFVGIDLLYEKPGSFDLTEEGQTRLGVVEVETRDALVWGISIRGDVRFGRGPWYLTMNSTMTLSGEEPFVVRTDPESGYGSSEMSFQPLTITIGFLRRF